MVTGRPGVLVLAFGGPRSAAELAPFLTELFDDVLPGPPWLRRFAAARIAASRSRKVRPNYEMIGWSPVVETSRAQADALRVSLGGDIPVAIGMMFSPPSVADGVARLLADGCDQIVALALFPQYSLSTTDSAYRRARDAVPAQIPVHWAPAFYDRDGYLDALAATLRDARERLPGEGPVHLVFSPHGLPLSYLRRGDPYPDQVRETVRRVVHLLDWTDPVRVGWQSRVGPVRWMAPSTEQVIAEEARRGAKRLLIVPLAFVGEHIETLHELDIEVTGHARAAGIPHVGRAAAVGVHPRFIDTLADLVREGLERMGRATCVRCLLPDPGYAGQPACPTCGFHRPTWT